MSLAACLTELENAIDAAAALGLDVAAARGVLDDARARLGFAGSSYVLALVGGTGVGKSSLLNALAGGTVSAASARRPTTGDPIAWVPAATRAELMPLLGWLGVKEIHEHDGAAFADVAVVDLPDMDSTTREHRAKVDELLPRVDAVVWVTDPEKYRDAVLHDDYVRRWAPRLARQLVVLNKSDRVVADAERVRDDLARTFREDGADTVSVAVASARDRKVDEVRDWIAQGADAKRVIAARVSASVRDTARELASRAGVAEAVPPLLAPERRARALADVTRAALGLVDLAGLERQAVAATRLAARPRGAGPLGPLTTAIYRASGRDRVAADPEAYLRRWRERGSLSRPAEPLRALVADVLPSVPPALRGRVASLIDQEALRARIASAIDAAVVARTAELRAPTSWAWSVIGALQYVVTAGLLFVGLWLATLFLIHPAVGVIDVPVLGPVPTPLIVLVLLLVAGYVLARMLGAHAGFLGRRWARRLRGELARELDTRLADAVFAPISAIDAARTRLATALGAIAKSC